MLPVLDLLAGAIVRGVGGQRATYRPIESRLVDGAEPSRVARALVERLGSTAAYLADLDAIAGSEPAWNTLAELAELGLGLWVDAGAGTVPRARALAEWHAAGSSLAAVIVGLESLAGPEALEPLVAAVGPERLVLSLDLRQGVIWNSAPAWAGWTAPRVAELAHELGVRRFVVLDVAAVGSDRGPVTLELCRELRARWPKIELTSGGGVRQAADLAELARAGCDYALVASALHEGRLTPDELRPYSSPSPPVLRGRGE